MNSARFRWGLIVLMAVLILILGLSAVVLLVENAPAPEAVAVATTPPEATATVAQSEPTLPLPVVEELPTLTPTATAIPTETPEPTATSEPSPTPEPTSTNTPVPVVVAPPPTAVPPTATAPPPTATPVPQNTQGLTALYFGLQDRSVFLVNQTVWFEFNIANNAGGPVPFGSLGVMPRKNGTDRLNWYQNSWGGNNDSIPVAGLQWEDNIRLPEAGSYTLRLVICFDSYNACVGGSGTWVTLSQEIPVTIN